MKEINPLLSVVIVRETVATTIALVTVWHDKRFKVYSLSVDLIHVALHLIFFTNYILKYSALHEFKEEIFSKLNNIFFFFVKEIPLLHMKGLH